MGNRHGREIGLRHTCVYPHFVLIFSKFFNYFVFLKGEPALNFESSFIAGDMRLLLLRNKIGNLNNIQMLFFSSNK